MELTFNEPVNTEFSEVVVTGTDGSTRQSGDARTSGAVVVQPLESLGAAGVHAVAWRVVSDDGHAITGMFSVTVTTAAATSDPPPATPATSASDATSATTTAAVLSAEPAAACDGVSGVLIVCGPVRHTCRSYCGTLVLCR